MSDCQHVARAPIEPELPGHKAYAVLLPENQGPDPDFDFTDEQRKQNLAARTPPWRIAPQDRTQPVHECASSMRSVVNVYEYAIEIGGPSGTENKRSTANTGIVGSLVAVLMFAWVASSSFGHLPTFLFSVSVATLLSLGTYYLYRLGYQTPSDLPVLFNRRTRKVTFFPPVRPDFWRFWKPLEHTTHTVSWDELGVRSYCTSVMTGEAVGHDDYLLVLLCPSLDQPRRFVHSPAIGYIGWWEDQVLWQLYEHIRQYMEEGGPPIRHKEMRRATLGGEVLVFPPDVLTAAGARWSDEQLAHYTDTDIEDQRNPPPAGAGPRHESA